jgi:hypothetical protein
LQTALFRLIGNRDGRDAVDDTDFLVCYTLDEARKFLAGSS